jgi:hypothetical protein
MFTGSSGPATVVAGVAAFVALAAVGTYAWSWPAAVGDFPRGRF